MIICFPHLAAEPLAWSELHFYSPGLLICSLLRLDQLFGEPPPQQLARFNMWQFVSPDDFVRCPRTPKTRARISAVHRLTKSAQSLGRLRRLSFPPPIIGLTQYRRFFHGRMLARTSSISAGAIFSHHE